MRSSFLSALIFSAAALPCAPILAQPPNMAPTIGDIPDVIVADGRDAYGDANVFVFPDAVDLNTKVADDMTTPGQILWSYSVTDPSTASTQVYAINGVAPLDLSSESRAIPPASKRLNDQDLAPAKSAANPRTITVRNIRRSPLPAQTAYAEPGPAGILADATRVITFHASDGSTASSRSLLIYTDNDGPDRLSGEIIVAPPLPPEPPGDWAFVTEAGNPTSARNSSGLCMTSQASGQQFMGQWFSPYGVIMLVPDSVYEARLTISTSQATPGLTPAFGLEYDNISASGYKGVNEFGGTLLILDNEGGALSPIPSVGRADDQNYTFMISPVQGQTPQFKDATTGFFRADNAYNLGMRLHFRLFQTSAISGYTQDFGSICLEDLVVIRHDWSSMNVIATPYQLTTFSTTTGAADQVGIEEVGSPTTMTVAANSVTLRPTASWDDVATTFRPGDRTIDFSTTTGLENRDNWPVDWKPNTIYYIEYELSAPTATDERNPPDVIVVGTDALTGEFTADNYCVPNCMDQSIPWPAMQRGVSTPRTGTPQQYGLFWHSLSPTHSRIVDSKRIRPKLMVLGSKALSPGGRPDNTGGITIHKVTVQEVEFSSPYY